MSRFVTNTLYPSLIKTAQERRGIRDGVNGNDVILPAEPVKEISAPVGVPITFDTERQIEQMVRDVRLTEAIKEKAKKEVTGGCMSCRGSGCSCCSGGYCSLKGSGTKPAFIPNNFTTRHLQLGPRFSEYPLEFKPTTDLGLEDNRNLKNLVYPNVY